MRASVICVLAATAASCSGGTAGTRTATPRPATAAESEAIQRVVFDAQRAGFVRHDVEAYLAQWTDDATIVAGRAATAGEHDFSLSRAQIDASKRARFVGEPVVQEINFEVGEVTIRGDEATLTTTTVSSIRDGGERAGEMYLLRKTAAGWRVYQNRYWMISSTAGGKTTTYDAEHYAAADARADEARAADDNYELGLALMAGWRWPEAHRAFVALTEENDVEPYDWVLRASAAIVIGDVDDYRTSLTAAHDADPSLAGP